LIKDCNSPNLVEKYAEAQIDQKKMTSITNFQKRAQDAPGK